MRKIIVNYSFCNIHKRIEIIPGTAESKVMMSALLYLSTRNVISIDNVLSISEVHCA